MAKKIEKVWAIYYIGFGKDRPGLCWWGKHGEANIYETKKRAKNALEKELKEWGHENEKKLFKIVRSKVTPL